MVSRIVLISYLRSSSYNTLSICEHKYFITYVLGIDEQSNKKADMGTVVHKVLEVLALNKLAYQSHTSFFDDHHFGRMSYKDCKDINALTLRCFNLIRKQSSHHTWCDYDLKQCRDWVWKAIKFNNGTYNPRHLTILATEQQFDITINKEEFSFEYLVEGKKINGFLSLKGTIDLVVERGPDCIEMIDWKTGQRKDWATGKVKDWKYLQTDPQLMLYIYVLYQLYPDVDYVLGTVFFINNGGPFTISTDRLWLPKIEKMIHKRFTLIQSIQKPMLIKYSQSQKWKCRFCQYAKNGMCTKIENSIKEIGMGKTMIEHAIPDKWQEYGSGANR